MDSCTPTAEVAGRQHLRSANQRKLIVPRYCLNSFGRWCFAVAGPSTWNSLPYSLRDPALSLNVFRRQLKTLFCEILTRCTERIRDFFENALYKFTLYLLTYLLEESRRGHHVKYRCTTIWLQLERDTMYAYGHCGTLIGCHLYWTVLLSMTLRGI